MVKISAAVFLLVIAVVIFPMHGSKEQPVKNENITGVWLSYGDFKTLGLYNQSEENFRINAEKFFDTMELYGINTVFFHVRAFRDAAYDSQYFPTAAYVWDRDTDINYDPLEIMVNIAHDRGMKLHAWLNPYRNRSFDQNILDPAEESTIDEILLCVDEIIENYEVDGIHFDDYFYTEDSPLPETEKIDNVNMMIKAVYKRVHEKDGNITFGISPAGNTSYCRSIGADPETWLSEPGYVDYIVPQIYWTDNHTAAWREYMFSDTLDEWISMNEGNVKMYIGLAAYKAGAADEEDPGWETNNKNLMEQVQQVMEKDCDGYVFFSAGDFYRSTAGDELGNYRTLVF